MGRSITDKQAMDTIAKWMKYENPSLNEHMPNWVWSLTAVIDDMILETGRYESYNG